MGFFNKNFFPGKSEENAKPEEIKTTKPHRPKLRDLCTFYKALSYP